MFKVPFPVREIPLLVPKVKVPVVFSVPPLKIMLSASTVPGVAPKLALEEIEIIPAASVVEPEYDFLSEIIEQVNSTYGVNLTDEDKVDLSRLKKRLVENPDIEKYMTGDNTEENKQNYFKEQFEDELTIKIL